MRAWRGVGRAHFFPPPHMSLNTYPTGLADWDTMPVVSMPKCGTILGGLRIQFTVCCCFSSGFLNVLRMIYLFGKAGSAFFCSGCGAMGFLSGVTTCC